MLKEIVRRSPFKNMVIIHVSSHFNLVADLYHFLNSIYPSNHNDLGKQLAESAKSQFSHREYSDHLSLLRAFEGWKEAERDGGGHEFCWRNFLSAQTLKAIDSLRKQFIFSLRDSGLTDDISGCNKWSGDQSIVRAVICAGLYPGVCSVIVSHFNFILHFSAPLFFFVYYSSMCTMLQVGLQLPSFNIFL